MPQRIAITGSTGQLGSELRDILENSDQQELIFLDRESFDLSSLDSLKTKLNNIHPDIIIHCGAYTAVDKAEVDSEMAERINHLSTKAISEYAAENGARMLYISTDYVFQGDLDQALGEDYPTNPINEYGESKRKGELAILENLKDAIIIRTSWVYSVYGKNFVKTMLTLMSQRSEINVVNDQIGSPTYALDLAMLIKLIVENNRWIPGIYHYSNQGRLSWYEFAIAIRDLAGLACKVNPVASSEFPTTARRPAYSLLDKSKVKDVFGTQVPYWKVSLIKMLEKYNHIIQNP